MLTACQKIGSNPAIPADVLESAQADPEAFGHQILSIEQRLAEDQTQLPKWPKGTANYVLLKQQIEMDQTKIQQMMSALSQLEATG